MSKYFDILAYLMGKLAGGGGGDISVVSKSISANGTYTAPSGKAYSPVSVSVPASAVDSGTKSITSNGTDQDVVGYAAVDVAVPNSYTAGDEGKVVYNGELVAQTAHAEVTQNGTIDTTLNDSVVVNVSGGGGYGYTKLAEQDFTVNTSSTAQTDIGTIDCGAGVITNAKIIYCRIRDKAGVRTNYFYGSDSYLIYVNPSSSQANAAIISLYYGKSNGDLERGTGNYGVYMYSCKSDGTVTIRARYYSDYKTIDGTFHVEVYLLDWPDGVSPFN